MSKALPPALPFASGTLRGSFAPPFAIRQAVSLGLVVIVGLLVGTVGLVAIGSGLGLIPLPFEMHLLDKSVPYIFRVHMVASALALLLAPVAIALRRRRQLHRRIGRLLGVFVVTGGLTSFPVAIMSHSVLAARAGFFVQGLVWLCLFTAAVLAIRARDRATHARLMLAMVAVASGAVWFRVVTGSAIMLGLPFEPIYAASAWMCWMIPLALVLGWPNLTARLRR